MNIQVCITRLEALGFYSNGIKKYEAGQRASHDAYDHMMYPRDGVCPHKEFIPPTHEGEMWAETNSLAKRSLRNEVFDEEWFEWNAQEFIKQFGSLVEYKDLLAFWNECREYWSKPDFAVALQEYYNNN